MYGQNNGVNNAYENVNFEMEQNLFLLYYCYHIIIIIIIIIIVL